MWARLQTDTKWHKWDSSEAHKFKTTKSQQRLESKHEIASNNYLINNRTD